MSLFGIDAASLSANATAQHAPGTLILAPTQTSSHPGPFWGLRFDGADDDGEMHKVIWLNGMPWHGPGEPFYAMPTNLYRDGAALSVGCGRARIEVDLSSGVGGRRSDLNWHDAAGFIAITSRATMLVGAKKSRQLVDGGYYAIDLSTWADVPDAHNDDPAEWFSRWQVIVETAHAPFKIAFDARAKPEAKAA